MGTTSAKPKPNPSNRHTNNLTQVFKALLCNMPLHQGVGLHFCTRCPVLKVVPFQQQSVGPSKKELHFNAMQRKKVMSPEKEGHGNPNPENSLSSNSQPTSHCLVARTLRARASLDSYEDMETVPRQCSNMTDFPTLAHSFFARERGKGEASREVAPRMAAVKSWTS